MDQESKTAPCAARQRAVYHRAGQDVGKGTQLRGGAGQHVRLIDEQRVEAALCGQHAGRHDWGDDRVRGGCRQRRVQLRAVGGVPDGLSQRGSAEHTDGAAALRRKHRFPRGVCLGGQPPGAVGLHQHEIGGGLPAGEVRRGELALRGKGAGAGDGAAGKGRAQRRFRFGKGTPVRAHDVGGGGQQHRAAAGQLLRQNAQEGGLSAAADHRRQAGADIQ